MTPSLEMALAYTLRSIGPREGFERELLTWLEESKRFPGGDEIPIEARRHHYGLLFAGAAVGNSCLGLWRHHRKGVA